MSLIVLFINIFMTDYQALARRYRPQKFEQIFGQNISVKALSNSLDNNILHHAYLFTGSRGVGKTTLSRLLAKSISCELGVSSKPCGICSNCIEIQNNKYIDYIEVDAASNRGVEEITKVLDHAIYQPVKGKFKIFMIDEVHMLSNHAFNYMLKILEEPPAHIKFIFATTEAHKIPATILSRCVQMHLSLLDISTIYESLINILKQENIIFEEVAIKHIAKLANGSMRDALSLTDQAIAIGNKNIKEQDVLIMLGFNHNDDSINILFFIINNDYEKAINISHNNLNIASLIENLIDKLQQIAILQFNHQLFMDDVYYQQLVQLANIISPESIQIYYQMCIKAKQELEFCAHSIVLNMLIIKLIHFEIKYNDDINNKNQEKINFISNKLPLEVKSELKGNVKIEAQENQIQTYSANNQNNLDIKSVNHQDWLLIVPKLNLKALSLELAKQSIWTNYDEVKNTIHMACNLDTSIMKNTVGIVQKSISEYFNNNMLKIKYSEIEKESEGKFNTQGLETISAIEKTKHNKNMQNKQELINNNQWIKSFAQLGAKIIIE